MSRNWPGQGTGPHKEEPAPTGKRTTPWAARFLRPAVLRFRSLQNLPDPEHAVLYGEPDLQPGTAEAVETYELSTALVGVFARFGRLSV